MPAPLGQRLGDPPPFFVRDPILQPPPPKIQLDQDGVLRLPTPCGRHEASLGAEADESQDEKQIRCLRRQRTIEACEIQRTEFTAQDQEEHQQKSRAQMAGDQIRLACGALRAQFRVA